MKMTYKLILNSQGNIGQLFIENVGKNNSRQITTAEKEAANGYIMGTLSGGFCRFDITTILGDMMTGENAVFDFIKATVEKPERFVYVQNCLAEYFTAEDFTIQKISQLMGKFGASFGEVGTTGATVYHCSDLQQVAFSILHFLILNGFKFASCKHCGRLYATKTLKIKYCNRKSTFKGYEEYSCDEARNRIVDSLEKRRKSVYEWLRQRSDGRQYGFTPRSEYRKYGEALDIFSNKCNDFKAAIKEAASIENLQRYSEYLYSGEGLPKRYERIKGGKVTNAQRR